ncbi:MAG: hypothetical protein JWN30_1953 [Bacilli bacterium]|nr:hypothetical protein [Bacilli bacterium]
MRYVASNHQEYNAKEVLSAGGGVLLSHQQLPGPLSDPVDSRLNGQDGHMSPSAV